MTLTGSDHVMVVAICTKHTDISDQKIPIHCIRVIYRIRQSTVIVCILEHLYTWTADNT